MEARCLVANSRPFSVKCLHEHLFNPDACPTELTNPAFPALAGASWHGEKALSRRAEGHHRDSGDSIFDDKSPVSAPARSRAQRPPAFSRGERHP